MQQTLSPTPSPHSPKGQRSETGPTEEQGEGARGQPAPSQSASKRESWAMGFGGGGQRSEAASRASGTPALALNGVTPAHQRPTGGLYP